MFEISDSKKIEISKFLLENNRIEYFKLIMIGLSNKEIAEVLNVSVYKAAKTIKEVLKIIGTDDRTYATTFLLGNELIPLTFREEIIAKYPKAKAIRDEKLSKRKGKRK